MGEGVRNKPTPRMESYRAALWTLLRRRYRLIAVSVLALLFLALALGGLMDEGAGSRFPFHRQW